MADNHLFIGIGGTGGKVLRELRKRVYEEFGSNDTPKEKVNLEYIYIDSSDEDLKDRTGWKVLGKSVHLAEAQKLSIHGINAGMLNELNQYPGLQAFLPEDDVRKIQSKIGPLIEQGIGGQRRRLGRILLANNLSVSRGTNNFVDCLKSAVERLTSKTNDSMVSFHICAGLAGGTGSGSIIDVISQIRKHYAPIAIKYKINLYLYLPEMNVVNMSHDAGFYQANGYAALSELNAISVFRYHPVDVSGEQDIFTGKVQRLLNNIDPFDAAFVYTNVNEAGKKLELSSELPAAVADFLFQHTIASAMVGAAGQMSRLIGCENNGAGAENDKANQPARSRKFLSFGIKRVEYPENEIKEYATYRFAQQAARQFAFNKWDSMQGYIEVTEDEVGIGFASEIREMRTREALMLSNAYLMLSKPIVEDKSTKRWMEIPTTWEQRTLGFADDVMRDEEKRSWLAAFSDLCEDYYNQNYRAHGVKKFYELQRDERLGYAKHIRRHIETMLFDEWLAGGKSILEVDKYLSILIRDCQDRIAAFTGQVAKLDEEKTDLEQEIKDIREDWNGISWVLDPVTGKSKSILGAYQVAKCDYYTNVTRQEGYKYAGELLQAIITELSLAKQGVELFKEELTRIIEEVGRQADSRCKIEDTLESGRSMKKYDPTLVRQLVKTYISTEELQRDNALSIRTQMVKGLGDDGEHSFANLYDKTDYETAISMILDQCASEAEAAMVASAQKDKIYKMVQVNILEKLKQELSTSEKLEEFVKKLVASASSFVQFNNAEMAKASVGNGGGMQSMVQLCIPDWKDDTTGFRNQLIEAFEMSCPGFSRNQDVSVNYRENQIVVVAAKSGFPLRYLSNLTVLKQKYDQLLAAQDGEFNRVLLHSETFDSKNPLPSLYEIDNKELKVMITKPIMLAYALGMIHEGQDPITQRKFDVINLPDPELAVLNVENLVPLGGNVLDTIEVLSKDYDKAKRVMDKVNEEMGKIRSNDQKEQIQQALGGVLAKIKACPECENNQYNPLYQKYQAMAIELIRGELAKV